MVKMLQLCSLMTAAAEDDSVSLMQSRAIRTRGDRVFDAIANKGRDKACVAVAVGDVAPTTGSFIANTSQREVVVAAGSIAKEEGSFCIPQQNLLLLQRTLGLYTAQDFEAAFGKKDESQTTSTTTTTSTLEKDRVVVVEDGQCPEVTALLQKLDGTVSKKAHVPNNVLTDHQLKVCSCRNFVKEAVDHVVTIAKSVDTSKLLQTLDATITKKGEKGEQAETDKFAFWSLCNSAREKNDWDAVAKQLNDPGTVPVFEAVHMTGGWEQCDKHWAIQGACSEILRIGHPSTLLDQTAINQAMDQLFDGQLRSLDPSLTADSLSVHHMVDHHFKAFRAKDVDDIITDYSDDAVVNFVNWDTGSMTQYGPGPGMDGPIRQGFENMFAGMTDLSDLETTVEEISENAFLIWKNPASGFKYGTDTFITDANGKFVRQHIIFSVPTSEPATPVEPDAAKDTLPAHAAWKRYFAAFSSQSVEDIVVDYAEDVLINVYNQADEVLSVYHGHEGVRKFFTLLFAQLSDTKDLVAPIQLVEEASEGVRPGRVLLLWSCPASGFLHATDTFVTNAAGKFTHQNVVVDYQPVSSQ